MMFDDDRDGCGDGLGDYWMTVPEDLAASDSYKIRCSTKTPS